MTLKRALYATTLATGIGLSGLFGVGLGAASARQQVTPMPTGNGAG